MIGAGCETAIQTDKNISLVKRIEKPLKRARHLKEEEILH